jgi:hypothetical protein
MTRPRRHPERSRAAVSDVVERTVFLPPQAPSGRLRILPDERETLRGPDAQLPVEIELDCRAIVIATLHALPLAPSDRIPSALWEATYEALRVPSLDETSRFRQDTRGRSRSLGRKGLHILAAG